jgi:hypothetical protein
MHKKANHNEMFSELFVYELGKELEMNMAIYERGDGVVKSLDFTDNAAVNFEPASTFMGDNEDYLDVIDALKNLCPQAIPDYIKMIFLDTICANPDRHTNNFGLLRDTVSGDFLGLAPNFDNNMALIARGYPSKPKANDMLIRTFCEVLEAYPNYREYLPSVTEEVIREVIAGLNMRVKTQAVINIVAGRYELIKMY